MYKLPDNIRKLLKTPIGDLVNEKRLIEILSNKDLIISIGDQVTYTILKYNINPIFCIIDYKTRRGKFPFKYSKLIKSFGDKVIKVENPQGCISDDLWNAIKTAFDNICNGVKTRIEVDGEEDLASIAAIYLAPLDVTIIYGLPDKGVLVVKPTKENKEKTREILEKM